MAVKDITPLRPSKISGHTVHVLGNPKLTTCAGAFLGDEITCLDLDNSFALRWLFRLDPIVVIYLTVYPFSMFATITEGSLQQVKSIA